MHDHQTGHDNHSFIYHRLCLIPAFDSLKLRGSGWHFFLTSVERTFA